jgi:chromosome segregation ATPase
MHADHEKWHAQHVLWLREIQQWSAVNRSILAQLSGLEAGIREQCDAIELHRESMEQMESNSEKHERLMEADRARFSKLQDGFSDLHVQEAKHHERQHGVHERLQDRQRELMSRIAELASVTADAQSD